MENKPKILGFQKEKATVLLNSLKIETDNIHLYIEALTHNSFNNEHRVGYTYQRLEFLGDAILEKVVSLYLFKNSTFNEKDLSIVRKTLVNTQILSKACEELKINEFAFLGQGLRKTSNTKNIQADLFEAFVGALYLDKGEKAVSWLLHKTIFKYYQNDELIDPLDYKTLVQELFQKQKSLALKQNNKGVEKIRLVYKTEQIENNYFKACLIIDHISYGTGFGTSKKAAEKNAAKQAYEKLNQTNSNIIQN